MANRIFNLVAAGSGIAFCVLVGAFFAANAVDPRKQFVSLSNGCHFSINARGADVRVLAFNDSSYGPYGGSTIGIVGDRNGPKVSGVGEVAGIYYRMIRLPNGTSLWTLSISLAYPLLIAVLPPAVWLTRRSRPSRRGFAPGRQRPAV